MPVNVTSRLVLPKALLQRPLYLLLSLLGAFVLIASATVLFKSPGIQFALSIATNGFDVRIGEKAAIIRDIEGTSVAIEGSGDDDPAPASNDPLQAAAGPGRPSITLAQQAGRLVKVDSLVIAPGSLLSAHYLSRDKVLTISVEAPSGKTNEVTATWSDVSPDVTAGPQSASAETIRAQRLSVRIGDAETELSSSLPFMVGAMQFATRVPGPDATYPVSLLSAGRLQFLAMGNALPEIAVEAGEMLQFLNVRAELGYLGVEDNVLELRLFGTADDVRKGYGSTIASVFPTAFAGLAAQPVLQVALSIILGATLALVGAVSLGSDISQKKSGPSVR